MTAGLTRRLSNQPAIGFETTKITFHEGGLSSRTKPIAGN